MILLWLENTIVLALIMQPIAKREEHPKVDGKEATSSWDARPLLSF